MSEILFEPIKTVLTELQAGSLSARELTDSILAHIENCNGTTGAVTDLLSETARVEASLIDDMRNAAEDPGPLGGLPILVKDIVDTVPAVCSAGLPFLENYIPSQDATIVKQLRNAGAVIIGVTATDPGAFGVRTSAVQHPSWPELTVGGSSGGSGAALAAGFGYMALGTDTGGSIRIPAAACEVCGMKPTYGRWPLKGIRPLTYTLDHVGPMARSVSDLSAVWHAFKSSMEIEKTSGFTIGVDQSYYSDASEAVQNGMESILKNIEKIGGRVIQVSLPSPNEVIDVHGTILLSEAFTLYDAEGLIDHPKLPDLPRLNLQAGQKIAASRYIIALQKRKLFLAQVDAALANVDFLISPTLAVTPPKRFAPEVEIAGELNDFTLALVRYTCLFNHTGHPVLAMPGAAGCNAPSIGIQLIGRNDSEADLLGFGCLLENALNLKFRHTPKEV